MELIDTEIRESVVTATEKAFHEFGAETVYLGIDRHGVTESVALRRTADPDVLVFVALAAWTPQADGHSLMIQSSYAVKNLASTVRREVDTITIAEAEQHRELHTLVMRAVESAFRASDKLVKSPPPADQPLTEGLLSSEAYEGLARAT
ncbi:hypothetical protein [Gordonia sp. ABSL49_1]|uniref:hypothetical protein n=1 Tax=unclassified Gordonia (in: high G+C Gram-positive bacteria) TaxID=2657482 RepID=UPI001F10F919|nr:hypothetical protein [Gordonia sp. ABSL49_1]MCH5641917.1 hypothetical protein [Gordonia sp. ABSL49_1]